MFEAFFMKILEVFFSANSIEDTPENVARRKTL